MTRVKAINQRKKQTNTKLILTGHWDHHISPLLFEFHSMPKSAKRKRKHSVDKASKAAATTATKNDDDDTYAPIPNPFWELNADNQRDPVESQVLQWMIVFVDHSKEIPSSENEIKQFQDAVQGLVRVLRETEERQEDHYCHNNHNDNTNDGVDDDNNVKRKRARSLSSTTSDNLASDIARLLFPWALQQVNKLLDGNVEIPVTELTCWQTLRFSLSRYLTQGNEKPPLSQSVLFKFVPRLLRFASEAADGSHKLDAREQATEVFQVLLVHEIFKPTLDVAVEMVLLPLVEAMKLQDTYPSRRILPSGMSGKSSSTNQATQLANWRADKMLQTVLQWIHTRLTQHGNQRTNFSVLARRPVLLAFARIHLWWQALPEGRLLAEVDYGQDKHANKANRQILLSIIYDDLVSRKHHMDGFKSVSVTATFSCYQNDFLQSLSAFLCDKASSPADVRDMTWFLPVIFRSFCQATRVWYGHQNEKYKKKAPPLSAMQFSMFERLANPLLDVLKRNDVIDLSVTSVGLRALREMTDLVDEFQAYVPAHDTAEQPQFKFLQSIAQFLIGRNIVVGNFSGLEQYSDSILLATRLVHLNHMLWRDQWHPVLRFSLYSSDARLRSVICTLWRVATETFTQLRQVDKWVDILVSVSQLLEHNTQWDVLADILSESSVKQALAQHVQSCPVKQIPSIFTSIQRALNCDNKAILTVVIQPLVAIMLRSFKVDSSTAETVASSLQGLVKNTINDSIQSESTAVRKVAINACGWGIDLSVRCAFWLGPSSQVSLPISVQRLLEQSDDIDDLLLVVAHRLRQIHSFLHEAQLSQLTREFSSLERVKSLEDEARTLVSTLYDNARIMPSGYGWTLIAQFLQFWAPFADCNQVDGFLNWLLTVVTLDSSLDEIPSCFLVKATIDLDEQREVAHSLLHDDAFFESEIISKLLPKVALKVAAQWITVALVGVPGSSTNAGGGFVADVEDIIRLSESDFLGEWNSVDVSDDLSGVDRDAVERCLCCATAAIRFLNGLPRTSLKELSSLSLSLLYLDRIVCDRYLDYRDVRFYLAALSLSSCLRKALCRGVHFGNNDFAVKILIYLRESLWKCSSSVSTTRPNHEDEVFFCLTGRLVKMFVKFIAQTTALDTWLERLLQPFDRLSSEEDSSSDHETKEEEEEEEESIREDSRFSTGPEIVLFLNTLKGLIGCNLRPSADSFINKILQTFSRFELASSWQSFTRCRIIAEAIHLHRQNEMSARKTSLREKVIDFCLRRIHHGADTDSYLEILLSLMGPNLLFSAKHATSIIKEIIFLDAGKLLIPSLVSSCLRMISKDDFIAFLEALTSDNEQGMSTRLLVTRMIFTENFLPGGLEHVLTENTPELLDFASRCMRQGDLPGQNLAPSAIEVWMQVIQSGQSIKREKIIALLGLIPYVLQPGMCSTTSYIACANLLALLLQRYSKHLSVCAPVVLLSLQCFLRQIIDPGLIPEDLSLRARYWTRLCELLVPQKEVYKKHLVYLVLESLRAADDIERRRALMPGWMYLLNTFSPAYEIKQLNALMEDSSTKMRFRPIYEQFRRYHTYQGS